MSTGLCVSMCRGYLAFVCQRGQFVWPLCTYEPRTSGLCVSLSPGRLAFVSMRPVCLAFVSMSPGRLAFMCQECLAFVSMISGRLPFVCRCGQDVGPRVGPSVVSVVSALTVARQSLGMTLAG